MAELSIVEAINDCFHVELERDSDVMVLGEDVGRAGGVFRATAGLRDRFGPDRCVDTPIAEAGIMGTAIGLAMAGWRPVCELQYDAFSYPALDQLINHVGRYRWRTRGAMEFPITVRMPYGGGVRAPELHDDSPETYYVHTPGVKVAIPSTPADAKGLLAAAIRDPDPVVILEPKLHYRTIRGEVPDGEHVVPLGKARVARDGSDVTIVAYGSMVPLAEQAADEISAEASVEVLDLRSLKPLDEEALLDVGCEDRAGRRRAGGAACLRLRRRSGRRARREGDPRPSRAGAARHRLRRAVSVLAARGRVHAVGAARARRRASPARLLTDAPYRIVTERLVLRCWEPGDAPLLKDALDSSLDHLRPWEAWARGEPQSLEEKVKLLRKFRGNFDLGQDFVYGIFSSDEAEVVGGTGLHTRLGAGVLEIGYWIRESRVRAGFATEATAALTQVALEICGVDRVEIRVDPANEPSMGVPRKLGFAEEARLRRRLPAEEGEEPRDAVIFSLFRDELANTPVARAQIEAFDAAGGRVWPP